MEVAWGEVGAHSVSSLPMGMEKDFRRECSGLETWSRRGPRHQESVGFGVSRARLLERTDF